MEDNLVITDELINFIADEYGTMQKLCEFHNMEFKETFEQYFNMRISRFKNIKAYIPRKKVFSWLKRK